MGWGGVGSRQEGRVINSIETFPPALPVHRSVTTDVIRSCSHSWSGCCFCCWPRSATKKAPCSWYGGLVQSTFDSLTDACCTAASAGHRLPLQGQLVPEAFPVNFKGWLTQASTEEACALQAPKGHRRHRPTPTGHRRAQRDKHRRGICKTDRAPTDTDGHRRPDRANTERAPTNKRSWHRPATKRAPCSGYGGLKLCPRPFLEKRIIEERKASLLTVLYCTALTKHG